MESTKPFSMEIEYEITRPLWNLRVGFFLRTSAGVVLDSQDADDPEISFPAGSGLLYSVL
jgi:hypothetical protein